MNPILEPVFKVANLRHLVRIGTRGSALALAQTAIVKKLLSQHHPTLCIEKKIITTTGDINPAMPLDQPVAEASGLFTRQLEEALLNRTIDAAVHSLKDLPVITPPGLKLAAILPRASTHDLLITLQPGGLSELASGVTIGTSAPRRIELLGHERPDLKFIPIRGNVPTRLRKLIINENKLDALILAQAGLERLGHSLQLREGKGSFCFDQTTLYVTELNHLLPSPGQGAIAVETRDEEASSSYFSALHDVTTAQCVTAERLLLYYLGGGCHMALGALAKIIDGSLFLKGMYVPYAGATPRQGEASGKTPEEVALRVATQLGEKLVSLHES